MNRLTQGATLWGLVALAALTTSCAAGAECERNRLPDGRLEVTCPRLDPIVLLEDPADPDAPCFRDEQVITCGGERFGLDGMLLPDSAVEPDAGPDDPTDVDPAPGSSLAAPGASGARRRATCQVLGDEAVCPGGQVATVDVVDSQRLECVLELLPGHGRRIVCSEDGEPDQVLPPLGTPTSPPECVQEEETGRIRCDDGSTYLEGDEGGPWQDAGSPTCESITVEAAPPEVVARCSKALSCAAGDLACLKEVASPASPECEDALTPTLVCTLASGEQLELPPETPCHTPAQGLLLIDDEVAQDLLTRDCSVIFGDVFVEARGGRAPDLRVLAGLLRTHTIRGSLQIIGATLPGGDEAADEFFEIAEGMPLTHVFGELRFEGTQAPVLALPELAIVLGDVVLQDNAEAVGLGFLSSLRYVGGSTYVSGHPELELVPLSSNPIVPTILGTFVWAANGSDACELADLMAWALTRASAVLIAAIAPSPNDRLCGP